MRLVDSSSASEFMFIERAFASICLLPIVLYQSRVLKPLLAYTRAAKGEKRGSLASFIYILGLASAPFLTSAVFEMCSRCTVWTASTFFYTFCNAMYPLGSSVELMAMKRIMAGSNTSVGMTMSDQP